MISTRLPGSMTPRAEAAYRGRWLWIQPLLVLAFVVIPAFVAGLAVSVAAFGVTAWSEVPFWLVGGIGIALAWFGATLYSLQRKSDPLLLRPHHWASTVVAVVLVEFLTGVVPAVAFWGPSDGWVWPLVVVLGLALPVLVSALAVRAHRHLMRPELPELAETAFVVPASPNGFSGKVTLTATTLTWTLSGGSDDYPEQSLRLDTVLGAEPVTLELELPPRYTLARPDGTGGVPVGTDPVVAVTTRIGTTYFPVHDAERFADLVARRAELLRD